LPPFFHAIHCALPPPFHLGGVRHERPCYHAEAGVCIHLLTVPPLLSASD
jgi:hypothetical protein